MGKDILKRSHHANGRPGAVLSCYDTRLLGRNGTVNYTLKGHSVGFLHFAQLMKRWPRDRTCPMPAI